jgi:hypothetical protein
VGAGVFSGLWHHLERQLDNEFFPVVTDDGKSRLQSDVYSDEMRDTRESGVPHFVHEGGTMPKEPSHDNKVIARHF